MAAWPRICCSTAGLPSHLPSGEMYPTLIRLPGYPLFLAVCFRLFGMENYFAAACAQIALELAGLPAAGRVCAPHRCPSNASRGAALATLWLAALCPFTASYTAAPLTETPTLFVLALAMWAMARFRERPGWANALWFTFAVTYAALLRPDGALAAVAFAPAHAAGIADDGSELRVENWCAWRWFAFCWRWLHLPCGRRATGASFTSLSRWRRGWPPIPAKARIPAGSAG